jgi:hypothetical protein
MSAVSNLHDRDVLGGGYPSGITTIDERRRWNQARLVALALARTSEPDMPNTEFIYRTARSIYGATEFAAGTEEELAAEIADARAEGWL